MNIMKPVFITTLSIVPKKEIDIYQGNPGKFYNIKGSDIFYDIHFPVEWALENLSTDNHDTGPKNCEECQLNGYYNGVFIGYCVECANKLNYTRGNGLYAYGTELTCQCPLSSYFMGNNLSDKNSMWNTYLKDIYFGMIGDKYMERNIVNNNNIFHKIENAMENGYISVRNNKTKQ
jgi:hypothetical protein